MEEGTKIINWKESFFSPQNIISSFLAIGVIYSSEKVAGLIFF